MDEINKLKIICRQLSIPFWYCNQSHSYNEKYSLCFSVKKCNLRILCSLWNYYGEFNPNVLFQYFSFDDRDEIRVTCDSEEISSIVNFFLHPVLVLDTSLFTYFQNILSKLREEGVMSVSFLNGCTDYPYFLNIDSYDREFKSKYLKCIWQNRNRKEHFGFSSTEALVNYMYEVYSVEKFKNPVKQLILSFIKKS